MTPPKISIIIVTYNSQQYLTDCLLSIQQFLDVPAAHLEIIVVDNSSGQDAEELKAMTENSDAAKVIATTYVRNEANLGYGQGNNVGIRVSKGDIICIMNPDVRLLEPLFRDVTEQFQDAGLALLGYRQTGGFNESFFMKPEFKYAFSGWQMKYLNRKLAFDPVRHYLSGAFFFISKSKFSEIGLFDENIFMYYEEPDIAKRLSNKNYRVRFDPSKKYLHLVGDRTAWSPKAFASEMNSLKYYLQKFSFDEDKIISRYLSEYQYKKLAARILKDHNRLNKFKSEVMQIKTIFKR